ncbi:MAG: ribonuclease P protein component [Patescibacteria group bacterium]
MLSKHERLGARGVKARAVRSGRFRFGSFKALAMRPPRASVVVSKKVARAATARNRIRRRFAAILRAFIRSGALSESVILYPNHAAYSAPHSELVSELKRALGVR